MGGDRKIKFGEVPVVINVREIHMLLRELEEIGTGSNTHTHTHKVRCQIYLEPLWICPEFSNVMKIKAQGSGSEILHEEHRRVNSPRWSSTVLVILEEEEERVVEEEIEGDDKEREDM